MNVGEVKSYFGEGTVLKGALKFKGMLRFDGDFEGQIETDDILIVGNTGSVKASISTGTLYNFGQIAGDVIAKQKISLHDESELSGNINTPVLITEENARFEGSCVMPRLPKEAVKKAKVKAPSDKSLPALEDVSSPLATASIDNLVTTSGGKTKRGLWGVAPFLVFGAIVILLLIGRGDATKDFPNYSGDVNETEVESTVESGVIEKEKENEMVALLEPPESLQETTFETIPEPEPKVVAPPAPLSKSDEAKKKIENREYKEAIAFLRQSIKESPENGTLRLLLAQTLLRTGKEKDSRKEYIAFARIKPRSAEATNNMAFKKLESGALPDAEYLFNSALKVEPSNLRAMFGLAEVFGKQGKNSKAIEKCKAILESVNDYGPAQNRLARIYSARGEKLAEAKALSEKSQAFFSDIPEYIDTLSEVNYKMKNYDEAIALIKKAISLTPQDPYYRRQMFKFKRAKKSTS